MRTPTFIKARYQAPKKHVTQPGNSQPATKQTHTKRETDKWQQRRCSWPKQWQLCAGTAAALTQATILTKARTRHTMQSDLLVRFEDAQRPSTSLRHRPGGVNHTQTEAMRWCMAGRHCSATNPRKVENGSADKKDGNEVQEEQGSLS